jgi:hypothetical protein
LPRNTDKSLCQLVEDELLRGIVEFEKKFIDYLASEKDKSLNAKNEKDQYSYRLRDLLYKICEKTDFYTHDLYILNFNYTQIKDYAYEQIRHFPRPINSGNIVEKADGSFYFTSVNETNVHGTIKKEIIIGIDDKNIDKNKKYLENKLIIPNEFKFSKTYRKMLLLRPNDFQDETVLPNKKDLTQIIFYGHSLGRQDYSYFQSIFDFYDIYNSNVLLKFCYADKFEIYDNVYNLIHEYGVSFSNTHKGKNLLHKLLLENRLFLIKI